MYWKRDHRHLFRAVEGQTQLKIGDTTFDIRWNDAIKPDHWFFAYYRPNSYFRIANAHEITFENPLGYYCAPNAADVSYTAATSIHEFLAWGMMSCFNKLEGDDGITDESVYWLRKQFLDYMKLVVDAFGYPGWDKTLDDRDGSVSQDDTVEDPVEWRWELNAVTPEVVIMDLTATWSNGSTEFTGFIQRSLFGSSHHRRKWRKAIGEAVHINELLRPRKEEPCIA